MKKNGFTLLAAAAFVLAALALPQPAKASCVYIDGCTYCVNDGGCCWQVGSCGCIEFQCRASAPPQGFMAAEQGTSDWWAAVVAQYQEAKAQPAPAEAVAR
ncbi:MAG TPA: hypothetical protein VGR07_06600 [Thermoanaerobaculia bacterium]|jgi:hypothetical protein|nr:hypothetical protein [Thermoanaerobaculia bacterium]